jgi:hypothetical protein
MRYMLLIGALLAGVMLLVAGCSSSSSTLGDTTQVKLLVGDAPLHLQEGTVVNAVNVNIRRVELLREADVETSKVVLFDTENPVPMDLLSLANQSLTNLPTLGTVSIPAGHYVQMRVILAEGNTVDTAAGSLPLQVASGEQTGFKVNLALDLAAGNFETILLDFNLSRLHENMAGHFILTPNALRVVKISQTGSIVGTVTVPEGVELTDDVQATLTLVDAADQPVLDMEQNAIVTQVTLTADAPTATFALNGVPTGSYSIKVDATYGAQVLPAFTVPVTITSGEQVETTITLQGFDNPAPEQP